MASTAEAARRGEAAGACLETLAWCWMKRGSLQASLRCDASVKTFICELQLHHQVSDMASFGCDIC